MLILQSAISQKLHKTKLKTTLCTIKEGTWGLWKIPWVIKYNPTLLHSINHVSKDLVFKVQDKRKELEDQKDGEHK